MKFKPNKSLEKTNLNDCLHMDATVAQISKALEKFLQTQSHKQFAIYIIQISNLPNLLNNFPQAQVYQYITKLIEFCQKALASHNNLLIQPCGLNNIMICMPSSGAKQSLIKIEKLFDDLQCNAMNNNWPIHFVLNAGLSIFDKQQQPCSAWEQAMIALSACTEKHSGYNARVYNPLAPEFIKYRNNIMMATYFCGAFKESRLELAYQPLYCVKNKKITSYECLMRIVTNEGDYLSAGPFIFIAERFGLINIFDTFTLKEVVRNLKQYPDLNLAMNVSNLAALNKSWQAKAKKLITPSIAKRLTIEITETGSMTDLNTMEEFVHFIKALGCQISIDDFGVGNTSFVQLKAAKPHIIKIDGYFIRDIQTNNNSKHFVEAIINLAKHIGAKTVAEYVENREIAQVVTKLGVDYMQGNYISQSLNYKPWL